MLDSLLLGHGHYIMPALDRLAMERKKQTIVLLGAGGQVATELERMLSDGNVLPFTHDELDIADREQVERRLSPLQPAIVINTAAYHRVDDCESHAEEAFRVNAIAVGHLARTCSQLGATLVHFSTDYVFRGNRQQPYREDDLPGPLNVYATSKVAGELLVQAYAQNYLLVRTCGVYGLARRHGKGSNFIETMLRKVQQGDAIRVVSDQVLTPTYARDLARKVVQLLEQGCRGLFHVTNSGQCSWFEFAQKIFEFAGLTPNLTAVSSREFAAPAHRPLYSVLDHMQLRKIGLDDMPTWEDALGRFLKERERARAGQQR